MPPGPPPKPNELKVLEGNPGKRRIKNSPKPERVLGLKPPKFLGKYGLQEWKRITPELAKLGMLTKIDQAALEIYCRAYQKWREAEDFLIKSGNVYTIRADDTIDAKGNIVKGKIKYIQQVPQVSIAQQNAELCRKMINEFGLSPAARSRLDIKVEKEVNEKDLQDFEDCLDG